MSNNSTNSLDSINTYTVPSGPFQGVTSLPGEIVKNFDDYSGRDYFNWDTHARTRHFLTVFSPLDGWRVVLDQAPMGVMLPDYSLLSPDTQRQAPAPENPAWMFTATLLDKDNVVVANASVVQIFNCAMSIEIGQTRARSKLYQALGLPSSPVCEEEPRQLVAKPAAKIPKLIPLVDVPSASTRDDVAPEPAASVADNTQSSVDEVPAAASDQTETTEQSSVGADSDAPEHDVDSSPGLSSVHVLPATAPTTAPAKLSPAAAKAQANATKGSIPSGLMRQITIRASRANVQVPELHTVDQATAFLAQLINPSTKQDLASGA